MMKNKYFLGLILVALSACNPESVSDFNEVDNYRDTFTYEGRVQLNQDNQLYVIVSLKSSGDPGEEQYLLEEMIETQEGNQSLSNLNGKYSLEPNDAGELIVHLHQSSLSVPVKRTFLNSADGKLYEENFRANDLRLKRSDDMTIARVVNPNSKKITSENEPILVRRVSRVFTVEGYFTHMGDSSIFREVNTGDTWPVSKLGLYMQTLRQYHQLATKKYEPVYLKGVGYAVVNFNRRREPEGEALVVAKLLQMSSAPTEE